MGYLEHSTSCSVLILYRLRFLKTLRIFRWWLLDHHWSMTYSSCIAYIKSHLADGKSQKGFQCYLLWWNSEIISYHDIWMDIWWEQTEIHPMSEGRIQRRNWLFGKELNYILKLLDNMDNKHLIKPNTVFENVKRFSSVMEVTLDQLFFLEKKYTYLVLTFIKFILTNCCM